ncbi:WG repeat-containing protein [Paenibacillus thermotolerans]|uniref:WG repeat-containing protein n=1 Tax=Paenibacillus thermotolerans TaxID=3027807 RepID=UPI002367ED62|nr:MULTISPECIES: WG repeat-containing protein [unclassified Paenibacillus]
MQTNTMRKTLLILLAAGTTALGCTSAIAAAAPAPVKSEYEYDFAGAYSDGLGLVGVWEGIWKYGYVDKNGKVVIKPQFNFAENFIEGTAVVGMGKSLSKAKYGYIKTNGSYLIQPQFDVAEPMRGGYAKVAMIEGDNYKYGIVDAKGNIIVKPAYSYIDLGGRLASKGFAVVQNGEAKGIVNLKTGAVTDVKYASILDFDSYIRVSGFVNGKEKMGLIFYNGKTIEPMFDWIHHFDLMSNVLGKVEIDGKFGLMGNDGKYVLEPIYDDISGFRKDEGIIILKKDGKYGFLESNGKMLTKIEYDEVTAFVGGVSLVKKDGKWGALKRDGTYKIQPKYDQIFISENEITVIENGAKKLLDRDGGERFASDYEYMYPYTSIPGASKVKKNGKELIIDKNGKPVFTVDFDTIWEFEDDIARIALGGKVGYLKRDGTYLVKPEYDGAYKDTVESYYHTKLNELWGLVFADGTVIKPAFSAPLQFSGGIGIARVDAKSTYIDKQGKPLTKESFDQVEPFADGMGRVTIGGKTRYVNGKGELVGGAYDFGYDFSDGFALVYADGGYRYIDKSGKMAFGGVKYIWSKPFRGGLAAVMADNGKWGYINTKGEAVIKPQFDGAFDFGALLAPVRTGGKIGFIDKSGKTVVKPEYDLATPFAAGSSHVWKGKTVGYISGSGQFAAGVSKNHAFDFSEGFAAVQVISSKDNRECWGYMKPDGSWLVVPQYDYATPFAGGIGTVFKDGKRGEVSKSGAITWQ